MERKNAEGKEVKRKWDALTFKLPLGYSAKLKAIARRNPALGLPQDRSMTRQFIAWIDAAWNSKA